MMRRHPSFNSPSQRYISYSIVNEPLPYCPSNVALLPQRPYALFRMGSPGRPPRVSHSSRVLTYSWLKCCFTSTETVGFLGTGAQDGHLDFHTAPELWTYCPAYCLLILHNVTLRPQTIRTIRVAEGSPGRSPQLPHSC